MKRLLITAFLCCLAAAANAADGKIRRHEGAIKDRYIVVFEDSVKKNEARGAAAELARSHGAKVLTVWRSAIKGFVAVMPEGRARGMSHDPRIAFIEEDVAMATSAVVPTNFDPSQACDPAVETCPATAENRLWHLDRLEQNSAALNNRFGYCSTGAGVYIYVVDTGVMAQHSEFWTSETDTSRPRVLTGYNAAESVPPDPNNIDHWPADNPCNGWNTGQGQGHGTAVASVAAGRKVGFARGATVVPVKVAACNGTGQTLAMITDGVDWIVRVPGENEEDPDDGNPEAYRDMATGKVRLLHPSVATFSTYRRADEDENATGAFELALDALTDANISIIASANNQNDDACRTTPARRSRTNPTPALRGKVITAGGSMILNSPMGLPVSSGNYDPSKPSGDGRWICDNNVDDTPCSSGPLPTELYGANGYYFYTGGSNWGPCVTVFAPARNITSAAFAGPRAYRTGMGGGGPASQKTYSSGTSFSAPIIAAAAARFLESNPNATPDQVHDQFTRGDRNGVIGELDYPTLGAGSPNTMIRFGDVTVTDPVSIGVDANGNAILTVVGNTGLPPLHYEWYEVTNPVWVPLGPGQKGWPIATKIGTDSPTITVSPSKRTSYWVRAYNDCCETDSRVGTVFSKPGPPQNVTATTENFGYTVNVSWTPADNNAEMFELWEQTTAATGFQTNTSTSGSSLGRSTQPDKAYVYRIRAVAGYSTSRPVYSEFSNRDLAVTVPFTDSPIDSTVLVKATHVTELRKAVNALCDHLGFARIYSDTDVLYTSLQNAVITAAQWSSLQTQINSMRSNASIGVGAFSFPGTPAPGNLIQKTHIDNLRESVK